MPGEPLEAGSVMEQVLQLVDRVAAAQQVQQDAGVDVAAAGAHDQPLEWRHPHRRVHRPAVADRGRRGAVAQVQHDQPQLVQRPTEVAGRLVRDVLVADAVHAIATDTLADGHVPVEGVRRGGGREAGEERGVEDGDLRQSGIGVRSCADPGQRRRVVEGRELDQLLDARHHVVVDQSRLGVALAAVHDAVPDAEQVLLLHPGIAER